MSAPDKIYLQWADEEGDEDYNEITWCVDQIEETDVEYCRITAEELAALRHVAEAAREFLDNETSLRPYTTTQEDALKSAFAEYDKCRAA